jgi:hypothetical protein
LHSNNVFIIKIANSSFKRHNNFMLNGWNIRTYIFAFHLRLVLWYANFILYFFFQITWALTPSSCQGICYIPRLPQNLSQCTRMTAPSDMVDPQVPWPEISRPSRTLKWREKRGDLWPWHLSIPHMFLNNN